MTVSSKLLLPGIELLYPETFMKDVFYVPTDAMSI
jgi:hypothetical protein